MLTNNWFLGDRPELGAMNVLNRLVRSLDFADPDIFPNLRNAQNLIIGSDYGGHHSSSQFEAIAFITADAGSLLPWLEARKKIREKYLPDGRRMSFKALNDRQRVAALPAFLSACDLLRGLLLVVLVDKSIGSLFKSDGKIRQTDSEIRSLSHWPAKTIERLLRICHLAAFSLAGLSREGQDVLWITDQDEIAANEERHRELVNVFGRISSHYLEHTLGHLRIATTASDTGKRDLEDFVAIADLAAGAVCQILNSYRNAGTPPVSDIIVPAPNDTPQKVHRLMNWFSDKRPSLKRLVISFEPEKSSSKLLIRHYNFAGTSDWMPSSANI